ncbi:MAG: chorismate mutase [Actinomycetales bacterium]|nr:chorismate mutase [Actinomycetales bacterium]
MTIRAVRGATQVAADEREVVLAGARELVTEVMRRNDLTPDRFISVLFTATRDLTSVAPALAARQLGLHEVALMCAQEMYVDGSMPRVVRLMAHLETDREQLSNVYLNGTEVLRKDVPAIPGSPELR